MLVEQNCSGILPYRSELFAGKRRAKETSSALWEQTVQHLRGSPEPSLTHWERHGVADFAALVVEKICSCAGSRRPMVGLVIALEMLAGRVEERHVGMTGRLEEEDQLERLRTRDLGGLHLGLLIESLALGLVVLSGGLAGVCGQLEFVA